MAVTLLRGPGVSRVPGLGVSRQGGLSNGSRLWEIGDASGLPRNGLVALYDPYRNVYGRNCTVTAIADVWPEKMARSGSTFLETSETSYHLARTTGTSASTGQPYWMSVVITPVGRKRFMLGEGTTTSWALYDTAAVAVVSKGAGCPSASITDNGDGTYTLTAALVNCRDNIYTMPDDATDNTARSFAGDTSKGFTLNQWQVNLGSTLFPYAAPSGAPGTLQTMADYHGSLYPLQLGSGATADAADPAFTGVSMLHAADYLLSGDLAGITMAGDWTLPIICKTAGTANTLVSLASAAAADQYQAIEYNGSTKVRIKTVNGATVTTSGDLTVSATAVQMLVLTSSGDTLTLKRMDTGTSVTATNADPTGAGRLCIGALGINVVATPADALTWYLLPLYNRAWGTGEATRSYLYSKSLMARRGVTLA